MDNKQYKVLVVEDVTFQQKIIRMTLEELLCELDIAGTGVEALELTPEQHIVLAREFIQDQLAGQGMVADWSIHAEKGNPHVHVLLTMRSLQQHGLGERVAAWNQKSTLVQWREKWSQYANFHLALHAHTVRIDHRSYKDQGIDLIPGVHRGKAASAIAERGIARDIIIESQEIARENIIRITEQPQLLIDKIAAQRDTFSPADIEYAVSRYALDAGYTLTPKTLTRILDTVQKRDAVFSEKEVAQATAKVIGETLDFDRLFLQIQASPEVIALGQKEDGRFYFTTRRLFALECQLERLAERLHGSSHTAVSPRRFNSLLAVSSLTLEQQDALRSLTQPIALTCLVGRAGTGKSALLHTARDLWESAGLRVHGVTVSGIAATALQHSSGIPTRTLASFCYRLQKGETLLYPRDVLVVEEAGMVDSPSLLLLLKTAHHAKAKVVLLGDPAQLQPLGLGAPFRSIVDRIGATELCTVYRQTEAWQREATVLLSKGQVTEGLTLYDERGCIHLEPSALDAIHALVSDWTSMQGLSLVLAHRNSDVALLNTFLRNTRIANGELSEGYPVATSRGNIDIAVGDRLLFLRNSPALGVSNGSFASVVSLLANASRQVQAFTVRLDGSNQTFVLDPRTYPYFTYGYAATVHKVQGVTVDNTLVYAQGHFWNRPLLYVAMSRHRKACHLYASQESHRSMAALSKHLGRSGLKDSVLDFPLAFAARRGIDSSSVLERLTSQLTQRLALLYTRLQRRLQRLQKQEHKEVAKEVPVETLLQRYIALELEQTRLVQHRYAQVALSAEAGHKASLESQAHRAVLHAFAKEALLHSGLAAALASLPQHRGMSLASQGGFAAIQSRIEQGQWSAEDKYVLLRSFQATAREAVRSQSQQRKEDQHRGGGRGL